LSRPKRSNRREENAHIQRVCAFDIGIERLGSAQRLEFRHIAIAHLEDIRRIASGKLRQQLCAIVPGAPLPA
jgi:ribosomal protein L20A (L18A)